MSRHTVGVDLPGVSLQVDVPAPVVRQIESAFIGELRAQVDRAAQRYAPNHRGFQVNLRDRVVADIEPNRLGRGGIYSFVDRVAYRMWSDAQRDLTMRPHLTPPSRVAPPPETGEMPAVGRRVERDVC